MNLTKLFSVPEPERRSLTKWVMLAGLGLCATVGALLLASACAASVNQRETGWKATFKLTVGNQPPMTWEADHEDSSTRRVDAGNDRLRK